MFVHSPFIFVCLLASKQSKRDNIQDKKLRIRDIVRYRASEVSAILLGADN